MQVHASVWLHCRRHWLLRLLGESRGPVALHDIDIEDDIRVQRNRLSAQGSVSEGRSIGELVRARNRGFVTLMKLCDGQVPAFENLAVSKGEGLRKTAWL